METLHLWLARPRSIPIEQTWGPEHTEMSAASKIVPTKSCIVDQSGKLTQPPKGKADDIGEVNRRMHPMGPPGQGTRQPRKDSQNNVEKILMAAGASSNLQRLLERGEEPKQGRATRDWHMCSYER